jgi:uncharacterized membrane protein (UPF0127 family)
MIFIKTAASPRRAQPLRAWRAALTLTLLLVSIGSPAQDRAQPRLPTVELTAGMHRIQAEVAGTMEQQMVGLMHRRAMGPNEGMLFVYEEPQVHCFWMRNTLLPLTIAFIDDDGRIVNLRDMQPLDESSHCAAKPVRFALEMHQGWFAKRGLKAGSRLRGAPFKP